MNRILIKKIDLSALANLEPLLSQSAGYPTSMPDEISNFNEENPQGWFLATNPKNEIVGFIRSFWQGTEWSLAELFVSKDLNDRKYCAEQLLNQFLQNNTFSKGHRVRFDFSSSDRELNSAIQDLSLEKKQQTFHYFELEISQQKNNFSKITHSADPTAIAEVLSYLHPVSASDARQWLENDSLRIQVENRKVVAAAQIYLYPNSAEVNRIATHGDYLRQGHAGNLMRSICDELAAQKITKLFLKVESTRTPAIEFYKQFGFKEIFEKQQTWNSIYF